jgi:GT2 family glycosyltransferase
MGAQPPGRHRVTGPITVVVATRNRRDLLVRTLTALGEMPERPPVIVVDDASSDGTPEFLREQYPAVGLIALAASAGAAARNVGTKVATTSLVAFSDDDSWYQDGSLAKAAGIFESAPNLALVAARVLVGPNQTLDPTCVSLERGPLRGFLACGAIVRREAFLSVGGFHPWMAVGGEEDLLVRRLAAAGWELEYRPEVTAMHWPPHRNHPAPRRRALARNAAFTEMIERSPAQATLTCAGRMLRQPFANAAAGTVEGIAAGFWVRWRSTAG